MGGSLTRAVNLGAWQPPVMCAQAADPRHPPTPSTTTMLPSTFLAGALAATVATAHAKVARLPTFPPSWAVYVAFVRQTTAVVVW